LLTFSPRADAGGLVFSGSFERYLRAYDDTTGTMLWQTRLNDVPSSPPITYTAGGKTVHCHRRRARRIPGGDACAARP